MLVPTKAEEAADERARKPGGQERLGRMRLVDLRARAMQGAYPHGFDMGVFVGLDEWTVSRLAGESGTRKAPVHAADRKCTGARPVRRNTS